MTAGVRCRFRIEETARGKYIWVCTCENRGKPNSSADMAEHAGKKHIRRMKLRKKRDGTWRAVRSQPNPFEEKA